MILVVMLAGAGLAPPVIAQPDDFEYKRMATREESRRATLAQYTPQFTWSPWYVIGPFDNTGRDKHAVIYPPELAFDPERSYPGKGGREVRWERLDHEGWGVINLLRFGSDEANTDGIAYLYRVFESDRDAEAPFEMGSDDGLKMWVNGKVLVDADAYRGLNPSDHQVRLPVREGLNTLLVKVTQGVGGWEFLMRPRIDSRIAARLEYHLNLDFPLTPESRHYRLLSIIEPEHVVLEVGGLDVMPDGRPIVTTRRGEAWIIEDAYADPPFDCTFKRFAFGLHEPLGAVWRDGGLYAVQRGEVTKLIDLDGDDRADVFETVSDQWGVSGNYHEFAFGPKFDPAGRMWVTLNIGFCGSLGKSIVPWRGWAMTVNDDGSLTPVCGGLRSPNGIGHNAAGDMFYTDNQGDWVGTNKLSHLAPGDWHGHPSSFEWYEQAGMPTPTGDADFKQPAVWFPYDRMGRSASDIVLDTTGGAFGPFAGQLFVGDQYAASIMRVTLEQVGGVYQGACYPFRSGCDCGVNRLAFAPDGSLFVGMTNRGWWSFGTRPWGVQRLIYTGVEPFEVLEMRVTPDGFHLAFTQPVDPETASDLASYAMVRFTYERWEKYGSPEIERANVPIRRATVAQDGRSVRLVVDGRRPHFVHELQLSGIRNAAGEPLLHDVAYYTLNVIPVADERADAGAAAPNPR
jgi:glucose/arabinose dehydrogenase